MSELPWGTEVAEEVRDEQNTEGQAGEPETLALTADEFSALEERVLRAVNLVKRERAARTAAEERASVAETGLAEQAQATENAQKEAENLQKEIDVLRSEREQVRQRVERLLSQLDALEG